MNPFLALSLVPSETWSFQRLPPPPSLLLLWIGMQGPGQSCVRQVSPPCSTWGREGTWWVSRPLSFMRCWNVGDAGTFLPLCPKERLLLCGQGWWQQHCLIPTGLLAWHEGGSDVALDWSSLPGFLKWASFSGPLLLPHCNQTDCWLKAAVNWRTKSFFPKWWGQLVPSHTFSQSQCHKTSNLLIRKQSLEGHTPETFFFLFFFFFNVAFPSILMPLCPCTRQNMLPPRTEIMDSCFSSKELSLQSLCLDKCEGTGWAFPFLLLDPCSVPLSC